MKSIKKIKKNLLFAIIAFTLMTFASCKKHPDVTYHAKSLKIDSRYKQEINFDIIGLKIPIKQKNTFVRIDEPVLDIDEHQKAILKELSITNAKIYYTNPAKNGRQIYLRFADGKTCSFIWVLKQNDERATKASIEHEKYHAIMRVATYGVQSLSKRIQELGFNINLSDYEEEMAATLIQVLSIHLQGVPFGNFSGSKETIQAKQILLSNYTKPDTSAIKDID